MRFLKKNRKESLNKKDKSKYLLYALGEILIVVIGIFIGLQVNKWNETNIKFKKTENYHIRIYNEVKFTEEIINNSSKYSYKTIEDLTYCLKKINEKELDTIFFSKIKKLTDNNSQNILTPTINEFIKYSSNLKSKNPKLLEYFQILNYFIYQCDIEDERIIRFDTNLKNKLMNKIIYSSIDINNSKNIIFKFKKIQIPNYEKENHVHYYNLEVVNLIYYKIMLEKDRIAINGNVLSILKNIKKELKNE